jgi:hypothetical protein
MKTREELSDIARRFIEAMDNGPKFPDHFAKLEAKLIRGTATEEEISEYDRITKELNWKEHDEFVQSILREAIDTRQIMEFLEISENMRKGLID